MPNGKTVYLDYAASAPMRASALKAEADYAASEYADANPNSLHTRGRLSARALDQARSDLARSLGGRFRPSEVTFTSGGTESNNLALFGLAEGARERDRKRNRVVISAIEHDSVLDVAPALRNLGFEVAVVRPGRDGKVTPEALKAELGDTCALVSVMYANNETGVVQPVPELADVAHKAGAVFHTDAVQAFGRIPLELGCVDAVSATAHKIGGPVGCGILAVRGRVNLRPRQFGGGQEFNRRPGTQDVRGALAFAAAAKECASGLEQARAACSAKARRLYATLCAEGTGIKPSVDGEVGDDKLPGTVSLLVPALDSETLVLALDDAGFEVSAGSACSSGSLDPSHVLSAMGIPRQEALGSLRVSFDERASDADLEAFARALLDVVQKRTGKQ
ncbi:cysteine desulfurase family protein [Paratractidigestivibacter sp.]|uniref:cysteine desulfurase family protein n=1 Tax=Paratractidigestivibacter sp. TaxID=2847316 RepID=UPI002ABE0154|nr:cysteine desulfurase family protein [Paratractidigestivibacter sp.]